MLGVGVRYFLNQVRVVFGEENRRQKSRGRSHLSYKNEGGMRILGCLPCSESREACPNDFGDYYYC